MEYKTALSGLAGKKKSYDVMGAIGDNIKKDKQWREFSDWINAKDVAGGKAAQAAVAKERSLKLMKQLGPKMNIPGTIGTAKLKPRKVTNARQADGPGPKTYTRPAPITNIARMYQDRTPTPSARRK